MADQQFCLRWNNFQANIVSSFEALLDKEELVDVTITAEGKSLKAHRVLLSACSPYFRDLFQDLPAHQHPVIVLRDTTFMELKCLLSFIYHGEVNVAQDRLACLLNLAETLKIKGLAQDNKRPRDFEQQLCVPSSSPERDGEDGHERSLADRERRGGVGGGGGGGGNCSSPSVGLGFSGLNASVLSGSSLPLGNLLVPLEPPPPPSSHKPIPQLTYSQPLKRRKHLQSPLHSGAGHTPPLNPVKERESPPPVTQPSQLHAAAVAAQPQHTPPPSHNSTHDDEDNSQVVNLSIPPPSSPRLVIPKLEAIAEEDGIDRGDRGGGRGDSDMESGEEIPPHDEDGYDHESEMPSMPHMSTSVQPFVPYPPPATATTQLESSTYPGPSGLPSVSQASWRSHNDAPSDTAQGGHPVFNELLCGDGVYAGKKAVPTPCPVCGKILSNAYNMRVHLETHQDITYKCLICGIFTRTRDTMRKHLSNVHKLKNVQLKNSFKKISGKAPGSVSSSSANSQSLAIPGKTVQSGSHFKGSMLPGSPQAKPAISNSPAVTSSPAKVLGFPIMLENETTPGPFTPAGFIEHVDAINLAKGSNLASIVNKLTSQKQ